MMRVAFWRRGWLDELTAQRKEVLNIPLGEIGILRDRHEFGDLLNDSHTSFPKLM